jgi:hypothetical protein
MFVVDQSKNCKNNMYLGSLFFIFSYIITLIGIFNINPPVNLIQWIIVLFIETPVKSIIPFIILILLATVIKNLLKIK